MPLNLKWAGKKSKCVAAKRWLQGWAATLLFCAQGDSVFIFFAGRQNKNLFYNIINCLYVCSLVPNGPALKFSCRFLAMSFQFINILYQMYKTLKKHQTGN